MIKAGGRALDLVQQGTKADGWMHAGNSRQIQPTVVKAGTTLAFAARANCSHSCEAGWDETMMMEPSR